MEPEATHWHRWLLQHTWQRGEHHSVWGQACVIPVFKTLCCCRFARQDFVRLALEEEGADGTDDFDDGDGDDAANAGTLEEA